MKNKSIMNVTQYHESNELGTEGINTRVKVWFDDIRGAYFYGTCVRYDLEEPHIIIIKLDNDNYVLGTECHFTFIDR